MQSMGYADFPSQNYYVYFVPVRFWDSVKPASCHAALLFVNFSFGPLSKLLLGHVIVRYGTITAPGGAVGKLLGL